MIYIVVEGIFLCDYSYIIITLLYQCPNAKLKLFVYLLIAQVISFYLKGV